KFRSDRLREDEKMELEKRTRHQENSFDHQQLSSMNTTTIQQQVKNRIEEQTIDRVLSLVSVTFQGRNKRTKFVEGPFPQFNQSLSLELIPPRNDFSPDTLNLIDEQLYFDLFDVITFDNAKDSREYNTINQRNEYRWLGS